MFIDLSDVLSDRHSPVDELAAVDMDEIRISSGVYPIVRKEPVHVTVVHLKDKEFQIRAETALAVAIPCDRCLEETEQEFFLEFTKYVDLGTADAELREGFDESNFIDGYHLDVDKMLFNEILVGWPTKVLCREDCKGICSICGQNLNMGACDCEDPGLDPRMSVVRELFKNFKEV